MDLEDIKRARIDSGTGIPSDVHIVSISWSEKYRLWNMLCLNVSTKDTYTLFVPERRIIWFAGAAS